MPELKFLPNAGDVDQGLGDAGVETFRDTPYVSVARECAQNSGDARAKNPVTVSFDLLVIDAEELPSLDLYRLAIKACLLKATEAKIEKEIEFFENAWRVLSQKKINILRISDTNTKGLTGPSTAGTPFHSLLKGSGVSVKSDPTSVGSFGIGKNAAFALSDIQTVFYSTIYQDSDTGIDVFLSQGKTILVSHSDESGNSNLAVGYWGEENYQPVASQNDLPTWLQRKEIGTTVFCVACREVQNWEKGLAASLLQNFFGAIHRGEMHFKINNGTLDINSKTIAELFDSAHIKNAAIENGQEEDFDFSRYLYESFRALETKEKIIEIPDLGQVSVRILVKDGLPKRVCFMRNGMFITDNLDSFGEKFRRFPLYKDFVALVEPVDETGQKLLKKLENPKHNGFSAERLSNPQRREATAVAMKKLGKKIREAIKSQSLEKPEDSVSIDELAEYFAGDIDPDKLVDPDSEEQNPELYKYKPVKRKQPVPPVDGVEEGGSGGGGGTNDGTGGDSGGDGIGTGDGTGGSGGNRSGRTVRLKSIRNVIPDNDKAKRKIILIPSETAKVEVEVYCEGINTPERIEITGADSGSISSGNVVVDFEKDSKIQLVVRFPIEYDGPIEVFAKSVSDEGGEK